MKSRLVLAAVFALFAASSVTAFAQIGDDEPSADPRVRRALDQAELKYTIDDDGDYHLVFAQNDDRTQLVIIDSATSTYGSMEVREVWSTGYRADEDETIPRGRLESLLKKNASYKVGAWRLSPNGRNVIFAVIVSANANASALDDAARVAADTADELELEWSGDDEL